MITKGLKNLNQVRKFIKTVEKHCSVGKTLSKKDEQTLIEIISKPELYSSELKDQAMSIYYAAKL